MKEKEIKELRDRIISLNKCYREGQPQVSDLEYDALVETLKKENPDDEIFQKGIIEEATDRMEELPMPMFSLEKIKVVKELRKWFEKMMSNGCEEIIITPKFDGISLLVSSEGKVWTRGDGYEGQRSDDHFKKMEPKFSVGFEYVWGEAIMSKKNFQELKESAEDFAYKNARNMVAGIFNSPEGYKNIYVHKVDFVQYGTSVENKYNKDIQLDMLNGNKANYILFPIKEILELSDEEIETLLNEEVYPELNGEYKIDGIVIEVNEYAVRNHLGRLPNGNPAYAIAYKRPEWVDTYQTKVTGIEYGIGKTGVLNPVILVEPVEMDGATVSRASAYNAAYLVDNHICEGALIEITRSGDVIPKHLSTISYDENEYERMMDDMIFCPSCGIPMKWDENHINLVCGNLICKERTISNIVFFFKTVGCEGFEEPTVRTLYDVGWSYLGDYTRTWEENYQHYLGKVKGSKVYNEIKRVASDGVPLARLMTAYNVFEGKLAEKTCQLILDNLSSQVIDEIKKGLYKSAVANLTVEKLVQIQGIGDVTAKAFIDGLYKFDNYMGVKVTYIKTPEKKVASGEKICVCMTGFRDKELENKFIEHGHEVLSGVTKDCNLLIVKDINSTSSKMKKAKEKGIKIITIDEFDEKILV